MTGQVSTPDVRSNRWIRRAFIGRRRYMGTKGGWSVRSRFLPSPAATEETDCCARIPRNRVFRTLRRLCKLLPVRPLRKMINSIDAMKAVDGPRQLTLGTENDSNEQLLVSVQDTGIGLPPNQAGQIFNAFFTTKEHGTGMGLRISRTIIEAHGGRLWATDNHPRGASFHFTLAVSSDAASWDARSNC
jgi:hypothetical protein